MRNDFTILGKLFLHGFCLVAQLSMRICTTFPLSKQWVRVRVGVLLTCCSCAHSIHSRNMQTPCRKRVDHDFMPQLN